MLVFDDARRNASARVAIRPATGRRTAVLVALVALAIYIPALTWGLPYATDPLRPRGWATDAISPLGPLTELHNSLVAPGPNRYLGYPLFHYLVLALTYAPYLVWLLLTGELSQPRAGYPFGFADPVGSLQALETIAKMVSASMAAGTMVFVYRIGATLWNETTGLLSAAFAMTLYPMFYYSRTGNLDVPVLFWTLAGVLVYARILADGFTMRRAVSLAVCAALATATKEQAYGAFVLMPLAMWIVQRRGAAVIFDRDVRRAVAVAAAVGLLTYSIASGFAIDPERHLAHLAWMNSDTAFSVQRVLPASPGGYAQFAAQVGRHLFDAMGPLLIAVSAAALLLLSPRDPLLVALCTPALGHFLFVLVPARFSQLRYVLFIAVMMCFPAARLLSRILRSDRPQLRLVGWGAVLIIAGSQLAAGVGLTRDMLRDSRYEAAEWLSSRVRPGDHIGHVISASSLPPLAAGVQYHYIDPQLDVAAQIGRSNPAFIILMPDWTTIDDSPYPARFPAAARRQLVDGSLGYELVRAFPSGPRRPRPRLDYPTVRPPIEVFGRLKTRPSGRSPS